MMYRQETCIQWGQNEDSVINTSLSKQYICLRPNAVIFKTCSMKYLEFLSMCTFANNSPNVAYNIIDSIIARAGIKVMAEGKLKLSRPQRMLSGNSGKS